MRALVGEHGIEAIAVCFLNSYVDARHEHAAAAIIKEAFPALHTSCSADIVPFMREYERWTTTTVNAYTQPVLDRYLGRIEEGLARRRYGGTFHVMTSSGGVVTNALARRFPVRLIESGPAAGILMTGFLGRLSGETHLLGFDMGGTTAKGSLLANGLPLKRYDVEVARVHDFKAGSGVVCGAVQPKMLRRSGVRRFQWVACSNAAPRRSKVFSAKGLPSS